MNIEPSSPIRAIGEPASNFLRRYREHNQRLRVILAELKRNPPPKPDLCQHFRDTLREGLEQTERDEAASSPKTETRLTFANGPAVKGAQMSNSRPQTVKIAGAYQVTVQRIGQMCRGYGLTLDDMLDPERVLEVLLTHSRSSPLRCRLADPAERTRIRETINQIS